MPTPFAPYANLRLLFRRPTDAPASLREGPRPPAVDLIVIEAFAEFTPGGGDTEAGGLVIGTQRVEANITRWAPLPAGAAFLDAGTSWSWTDTGLRPQGLATGLKLQAFTGSLTALPTISDGGLNGWLTIDSLSNVGGIDGLVRQFAGDELTGTFATGR